MCKKQTAIKLIQKRITNTINKPNYCKEGHPTFHIGSNIGLLLIPGFANTSHIMREYERYFVNENYTVYNTTLPGRGTTLEDLAKTTWQEWVDYAIEDYHLLRSIVDHVFIAGFSTGGTIALYIAQQLEKRLKPDGIILLSPAIFLRNSFIPLSIQISAMKLYSYIEPYPRKFKDNHLVVTDPVARAEYDKLTRTPAKSIIELMKLIREVKKRIKQVDTPSLTMQSANDVVIHPSTSIWVTQNISSRDKRLVRLQKSGHAIIIDPEKNVVFKESYNFIERITSRVNFQQLSTLGLRPYY